MNVSFVPFSFKFLSLSLSLSLSRTFLCIAQNLLLRCKSALESSIVLVTVVDQGPDQNSVSKLFIVV
jgi:hypothetical protein